MKRIGKEGVLDVGGDELLMLLLVVEADVNGGAGLEREGVGGEQAGDGIVNVGAVFEDELEGGAGEAGAEGFFGLIADEVVVGVEEPEEVRIQRLVVGVVGAEDEGLEEPGGVGEVPFDGAGVGR